MRYVLGIDFGTLSGRALLVNADTGEEVAWADHNYKNGVIEESLPGIKKRLKPLTALQDPADYIEVLRKEFRVCVLGLGLWLGLG